MIRRLAIAACTALLIGCSTTSNVQLAPVPADAAAIRSVSFVPQGGNSADMDQYFQQALLEQGLSVASLAAPGTHTARDADAVLSYSDKWRRGITMYLKDVEVSVFEARSGKLLASGHWGNSALHGYPDAQEVVHNLVRDIFLRLRSTQQSER